MFLKILPYIILKEIWKDDGSNSYHQSLYTVNFWECKFERTDFLNKISQFVYKRYCEMN